jgi:hypothetical protein
MKKLTEPKTFLIFLSLFFFNAFMATAQRGHIIRNQGIFIAAEGFYGHGNKLSTDYIYDMGNYTPSSYGIKFSANKFVNYHLSLGAGLGLLNYEDPGMVTFPALLNSQAYLRRDSNTPFVYAEGGYGFRFNHKKQDKGFLYELGLGYRYRVRWQNFVVVKVGYHNFTNNEWLWKTKLETPVDPLDPNRWYNLKRQTITFAVGIYFAARR